MKMTDSAVEKRGEMIERFIEEKGVSPETIREWADDPKITSMINAMAQVEADAE